MARPVRLSADDILVAAEREFTGRGYGDTSLRQLIAAAGVSTTAFYARFASKQDVLVALVERLIADLFRAEASALVSVRSTSEGVERAVQVLIDTFAPHRGLVALALTEGLALPALRRTMATAYRGLVDMLATQLAFAAGAAGVSLADPTGLAWAFVGGVQLQITRWAVFEEIELEELGSALRQVGVTLLPAVSGARGSRPEKRR